MNWAQFKVPVSHRCPAGDWFITQRVAGLNTPVLQNIFLILQNSFRKNSNFYTYFQVLPFVGYLTTTSNAQPIQLKFWPKRQGNKGNWIKVISHRWYLTSDYPQPYNYSLWLKCTQFREVSARQITCELTNLIQILKIFNFLSFSFFTIDK